MLKTEIGRNKNIAILSCKNLNYRVGGACLAFRALVSGCAGIFILVEYQLSSISGIYVYSCFVFWTSIDSSLVKYLHCKMLKELPYLNNVFTYSSDISFSYKV